MFIPYFEIVQLLKLYPLLVSNMVQCRGVPWPSVSCMWMVQAHVYVTLVYAYLPSLPSWLGLCWHAYVFVFIQQVQLNLNNQQEGVAIRKWTTYPLRARCGKLRFVDVENWWKPTVSHSECWGKTTSCHLKRWVLSCCAAAEDGQCDVENAHCLWHLLHFSLAIKEVHSWQHKGTNS